MLWRKQEGKNPEPPEDGYVIIKLSKELVVTFLAGLAVGCSGTAGAVNRLVAQPDTPAIPATEESCPQL